MNNQLKRVGVLGGTFDPVHNGHLGLAREAIQLFNLNEVLFVPVSQSPHKLHYQPTSSAHRIAMLQRALEPEAAFSLELMETKKGGVSYTVDTLSELKDKHPDWELFLILGADAFVSMDTWKQVSDILNLCHICVGTRPGIKLELPHKLSQALGLETNPLKDNPVILPTAATLATGKTLQLYQIPPQDISSREIRQKIQAGKEVKNLLPPAVDHYIMNHRLYRIDSPPTMI